MVDLIVRELALLGIIVVGYILICLIKNFIELSNMIKINKKVSKCIKRKDFLFMKNGGIKPDDIVDEIELIKFVNRTCNITIRG